jgi:ribosome-associated translation inhibitor RaiA
MQQELRIAFRDMDASQALERRIRARVAELEKLCGRITACDVVVEARHRHQHQAKMFDIHIDLAVPGRTIVVRHEAGENHPHEDAHATVRSAFDAARRQLEDYMRVLRGEVKAHAKPALVE